jgi:hypothetical protein
MRRPTSISSTTASRSSCCGSIAFVRWSIIASHDVWLVCLGGSWMRSRQLAISPPVRCPCKRGSDDTRSTRFVDLSGAAFLRCRTSERPGLGKGREDDGNPRRLSQRPKKATTPDNAGQLLIRDEGNPMSLGGFAMLLSAATST